MIPSLESHISTRSLPRVERLRGKKTFQLLYHLSKQWESGPVRLYAVSFLINLGTPPLRVAFSVPKKFIRKAAHRNRVRRRMREAYRQEKPTFLTQLCGGETWLLWQWRSSLIPSVSSLREWFRELYDEFYKECYGTSLSL